MTAAESTSVFQKIAMTTGLPSLFVEAGFLLLMMVLFLIIVLVLLAIFRIRKEMVRMNHVANYIAQLLKRGYKELNLSQEYYDFRADEWREETKYIVFEMLKKGKSYDEIAQKVDVSQAYVNLIKRLAIKKGVC